MLACQQTLQLPLISFEKNGNKLYKTVCIGKTGPHGCCGFSGKNGQLFGVPYIHINRPICYLCHQKGIKPNENYSIKYDKTDRSNDNVLCVCQKCNMYCTVHEEHSLKPICFSCRCKDEGTQEKKRQLQEQKRQLLGQYVEPTLCNQNDEIVITVGGPEQKVVRPNIRDFVKSKDKIVQHISKPEQKTDNTYVQESANKIVGNVEILEECQKTSFNKETQQVILSNGSISKFKPSENITAEYVFDGKQYNVIREYYFDSLFTSLRSNLEFHECDQELEYVYQKFINNEVIVIGRCDKNAFLLSQEEYLTLLSNNIPISELYINMYQQDRQETIGHTSTALMQICDGKIITEGQFGVVVFDFIEGQKNIKYDQMASNILFDLRSTIQLPGELSALRTTSPHHNNYKNDKYINGQQIHIQSNIRDGSQFVNKLKYTQTTQFMDRISSKLEKTLVFGVISSFFIPLSDDTVKQLIDNGITVSIVAQTNEKIDFMVYDLSYVDFYGMKFRVDKYFDKLDSDDKILCQIAYQFCYDREMNSVVNW